MPMNPIKPHGPWKIRKTDEIYRDSFIEVILDQVVRPDGRDGQHVVVSLKPGVCVLAIDSSDHLYLTREFHYGIGRESLEAVSGGIESGEAGLICAQRELREELGIEAAHWEHLSTVDPFTTVVVSPTQLFVARDLSEVHAAPEGTEQIERVVMPLSAAVAKVRAGEITHAPTCVLILLTALGT